MAYNTPMQLSFVRENVRQMSGYTPGEQPSAGSRIIKLNTNENPFLPSPRVMQAIAAIAPDALRKYPNPTADPFRIAAARVLGVQKEMILAGNGSDDILTIATRTFVPPGGRLAFATPTYSLYPVLAKIEGASSVAVPWLDGYRLPIEALVATKADAIYLANPNAPTGSFVSPDDVARLARSFSGLLLVDEAYADFAEDNCLRLVRDHANVVISRTLSKAYSLAGLRFGFAVAQAPVIEQMMKVKDSYNCDAISIAAATAAIEDQPYARQNWQEIRHQRGRLTDELSKLGWTVIPSHANFVLATVPDGHGKQVYQSLKQRGILVRYFDQPGLYDKVRITVGTSDENDALLAGIAALGLTASAV